jgi:four helix bundle protein
MTVRPLRGLGETVMNDLARFPHQRTDIYQAMLELVRRVHDAQIKHAILRDQAERAAISCILAIGEGLPHHSVRMRAQFFERCKASLGELVTATDTARTIGVLVDADWLACQQLAGRVRAMLIGVLR